MTIKDDNECDVLAVFLEVLQLMTVHGLIHDVIDATMDGEFYKNISTSRYVILVHATMFECMPYPLRTFINRNTSAEMAPELNNFFYIMRMCCVDLSFNMQ